MEDNDNGLIVDDSTSGSGAIRTPSQAAPTGGPKNALNISELLNRVGRQSKRSEAGNKYVDELTSLLKADLGDDVEVNNVPDTILNMIAVTFNKTTFTLTFSETYTVPKDTCVPPTDQIGPASQYIHSTYGGSYLDNLVVTPADYGLVDKMALHIARCLRMRTGAIPDLTIANLQAGKFSISTNVRDVRDAVEKFNPKVVQPRVDGGIVLYINEEFGTNGQGGGMRVPEPILVLGGYTNFVSAVNTPGAYNIGAQTPAFVSLVTITTILSPFMCPEMIALAIPLATEHFIRMNGWLAPYTKFGKKDPNLGALIADENDKPCFIENINELYGFVREHIQPPHISFDVTDGQARIPGIEGLRYDDTALQGAIGKFLGVQVTPQRDAMVIERFQEYTGEINGTTDSRSIDYLSLVASGVKDPNLLLRYLYVAAEPQTRASLISSIADMETLYSNCRVVLNSQYVDWLSEAVAQNFRPLWENSNVPENVIGALGAGTGNQFKAGPAFAMGVSGTGFAGFRTSPFGG